MDFSEYQAQAMLTASFGPLDFGGVVYTALGVNGETGEVLDVVLDRVISGKCSSEAEAVQLLLAGCALARASQRVAEATKKQKRDKNEEITAEFQSKIKKETGDVLWYIAVMNELVGNTMEDVARTNIDKLAWRKKENKIHDDGSPDRDTGADLSEPDRFPAEEN